MSAVKEYVSIAREQTDLTAVQLAMGFVMRNPLLGSVVVGATSVDQLQELIDAAVGVTARLV
jgi:aryl-alcohol dehydrogenase-like predicted oxidoreductase